MKGREGGKDEGEGGRISGDFFWFLRTTPFQNSNFFVAL